MRTAKAVPAPRTPAPVDTPELRARAAAGDRDAFAALYAEYRQTVYLYLYRRCGSTTTAEDLTQDTFARALKKIRSYREMDRGFGAWLCRIAHNLLIDHFKSGPYRYTWPVDWSVAWTTDTGGDLRPLLGMPDDTDLAEEVAVKERAGRLRQAMGQLTDTQRMVVELRYFDQLSTEETALKLDMTVGAVKAALCRGVRALARNPELADLAPWAVAAA